MCLENSGSRVSGLRHRTKRDQNVNRKSGHSTELENAEVADRGPVIPRLRQFLETVHPGLLPGSLTAHRIDKEGATKGMDLEPRSGEGLSGTKTEFYHGTDPSALGRNKARHHRNRRLGLCAGGSPVPM